MVMGVIIDESVILCSSLKRSGGPRLSPYKLLVCTLPSHLPPCTTIPSTYCGCIKRAMYFAVMGCAAMRVVACGGALAGGYKVL